MEVANWIHGMIDIQMERAELVGNDYTWPNIYQMLDDKYRKHQKKRRSRNVRRKYEDINILM